MRLDDWNFFDRSLSEVDLSTGFIPKNNALFNAILPTAVSETAYGNMSQWPSENLASFGLLGNDNDALAMGLPLSATDSDTVESSCPSLREISPTPSLCADDPQPTQSYPTPSPSSLKREWLDDSADDEAQPKRVQRKRGRPRINRSESDSTDQSTGNSPKSRLSRRLPHNQVERKYREGLNSELERLRRAVPTLLQQNSSDLTGPLKPSKAMVLASAIDYIKAIKAERDKLLEENEYLRNMRSSNV